MNPESEDDRPDRAATDESLRAEREKTDRALAESRSTVEDDADDVVRKAREKADAVLELARDQADQRAVDMGASARAEARVARERAVADQVLREERATADAGLQREREQQERALALLLPLEREKTDRYLLTERVRSDHALSNRDDFLGIVSHDLRNLLYGVLMSAQQLAEPGVGEAGAQEVGERIKRYAARMNRLIGDLLDVDSIAAGRLTVVPVLGDLSAVVREAIDAFHAVAAAKSISLDAEQQEQPLVASYDHDRILQVLANLITNAIKFTPKGGRIRVHCERTGALIRVSVSDSGEGVPAAMLEAIFERFWQVGKDDRRGLGLGLYISRCIVEAHHGTIWAESKPGAGSVLRFTLPAAEP